MRRRTLFRLSKKSPYCRPGLPRFPHPLPIQLAHIAQWFHAASDTTRLAILELLSQRERCVSEIAEFLGAPLSTVSFHLRELTESGLIYLRRDGPWRYYGIRGDTLEHMMAFVRVVGPAMHRGTCPLSCCQDEGLRTQ
jgi:ArsR family transcriptional regulator, arsenate/arsenite/antimonite-responsive transcriptional repressor